ncbi:MAG TPA: CCA tRNA nucleotidyltransferase [Xanthobacteraceae bacterium]|jgi:poly(A) polymerase|nr:CCA tRNA nucleotidyltransferase [Xanthobacteraceae bacterium]
MTAAPQRLDADWLREDALATLLALLDSDGQEARVVGGAVRNTLLGYPVGDVDIATTATPEEVIARVEAAGYKAVPTGIEHGTITVVADGRPHEVTTLREDVETDGRRAKVAFGRDWRRDAERRDFTMNALSVSRDGVIHDYVGGLVDLRLRRVRFIGDPATRIAEDYLRVLRFFRFHAAYGHGRPDPAGLAACIAARAHLDRLSRERVKMELFKLLLAAHAVPVLEVMSEAGLLQQVLAGVPVVASLRDMTSIEASLGVGADPVRRLGALALFTVEDADRLRKRLRLANAEHERLYSMADGWWRIAAATAEQDGRPALYRLGRERFTDRVLLAWARSGAGVADTSWHELARLPERWTVPDFPLKAADFVKRGVAKGPALGTALRAAEEVWIAADFPTEAADIAAIADAAARRALGG